MRLDTGAVLKRFHFLERAILTAEAGWIPGVHSIEVKALLVGQGVDAPVKAEMLRFLEAQPAVERILNLVSLQMGSDVMVAIKARMKPAGTDVALVERINATEAAFRQAFPQVAFLFFEPDLRD